MEDFLTDLFKDIFNACPKLLKYIIITLLEGFIIWLFVMVGLNCSVLLWKIVCGLFVLFFFGTYIYIIFRIHKGKDLYEKETTSKESKRIYKNGNTSKESKKEYNKKYITERLVKEIKKANNTNLVKVVDEDYITLPFVTDTHLEIWPMGENETWVYFMYGNEEECFSTDDFDSINDFINTVVNRVNLFWNKKIKIVTEKKPFHYYKYSEYFLNDKNNWQKYEEYESKCVLILKKSKREITYDFSIKK